jgi:hypothetical protein
METTAWKKTGRFTVSAGEVMNTAQANALNRADFANGMKRFRYKTYENNLREREEMNICSTDISS